MEFKTYLKKVMIISNELDVVFNYYLHQNR